MSDRPYRPPPEADVRCVARVWFELCERHGVDMGDAVRLMTDLLFRYSSEDRAYHDLRHVRECLEVLERNTDMADDLDALRWAIVFHDCIYDTTVEDRLNVVGSATLAAEKARANGLPETFATAVERLVMATAHGDEELASTDERLIADIDMAVLSWPYDRFRDYGERIRAEYPWATDEAFREGRAAFFESMLAKPRIYLTEVFRERHEAAARSNMTRALAVLRGAA